MFVMEEKCWDNLSSVLKPCHFAGSEDEEDENDAKLSQSVDMKEEMDADQSDVSLGCNDENEPMETEMCGNEREGTSPSQVKKEVTVKIEQCPEQLEKELQHDALSPRRLEVMRKLNFPTDLLTLRQVDESEFQQTGIPWSVTSLATLPKGCTVGPYQGETVALSSIKPGELVLQVSMLSRSCRIQTNYKICFIVLSLQGI